MSGTSGIVMPSYADAFAQRSLVASALAFVFHESAERDRHAIWTRLVSGKIGG